MILVHKVNEMSNIRKVIGKVKVLISSVKFESLLRS